MSLQDILNFDTFFKSHADASVDSGIRKVNSMTFMMKDAFWWNALHPTEPLLDNESVYSFHYKMSMLVQVCVVCVVLVPIILIVVLSTTEHWRQRDWCCVAGFNGDVVLNIVLRRCMLWEVETLSCVFLCAAGFLVANFQLPPAPFSG